MPTRKLAQLIAISLLCLCAVAADTPTAPTINHPALSKLKWQLACQSATFGNMNFADMVDQLHAMGIHHIELSPGQLLGGDFPDVKIGDQMTDPQIEWLQAKVKSVKMDVVSYGVVQLTTDPDNAQAVFAFAKKLRLKNVVVKTSSTSLETLDKIATGAGVHAAVISDPQAADCDAMLKLLKDRSAMVGACIDLKALHGTGIPLQDCLQKLSAKIVEVNLSDIKDSSATIDLTAILTQLKQQNFKGIFAVASSQPAQWPDDATAFSASVTKAADAP